MKLLLPLALGLTCLLTLPSKVQAQQPARQYYLGLGGVVGSYQLTAAHTNSVLAPNCWAACACRRAWRWKLA